MCGRLLLHNCAVSAINVDVELYLYQPHEGGPSRHRLPLSIVVQDIYRDPGQAANYSAAAAAVQGGNIEHKDRCLRAAFFSSMP